MRSRSGEVTVEVSASEDVMPGVVSLPHGYGHDRPGVLLSVAATLGGASANDLTDPCLLDELTGTAALNGVPVTVEPLTVEPLR
ncbi:molybdopterin dinucleotide binding domain-containing protein [Nonomuraea sp. NPDC049377]|uniref:molybdopterin dinucleotide binding domain-containing protein n=1 Tax=Nonomuraea sp. NPDC049377 TaxID=3364351 RepID=UPI0037A87704